MSTAERLHQVMQDMLSSNVVAGPALSSVGVGGLDKAQYALILQRARTLYFECCSEPTWIPDSTTPLPLTLTVNLLVEAITSTSAFLSHVKLGYLEIDGAMVQVAGRLIEQFVLGHTSQDFLSIAFMIHAYDDLQVLHHYGDLDVAQFLSGALHRPWIHYTLDDELEYLLNYGSVTQSTAGVHRTITLSEDGKRQFQRIEQTLRESGMLKRRLTLMRWTQFSEMEDYDRITNELGNMQEFREEILRKSGIEPGMKVLELGCGTGAMTVDSGLYRIVGAEGRVIATDPSLGMLARAKEKQEQLGLTNVDFVHASAEEIPFAQNTFDAVVGCFFLHFTHLPSLFREVHRVAKNGAQFTTIYPLHFPQSDAFFTEWFAPLLSRIQPTGGHSDILPDKDTVASVIPKDKYADVEILDRTGYGYYLDPESIVKFIVQAGNFFESGMSGLPWQAQQDMIQLLISRGHDVVRTYPREALTQAHPSQFFRARIMK